MPDHPSSAELSDFVLGKLPPDAGEVVAEHVADCPPCQDTVRNLDAHSDTLLSSLKHRPAAPPPVEAECRRAIDKAATFVSVSEPAAAADAKSLSLGPAKEKTFGDYVVLSRIGAGGMGQVFKARHRRMDRIVALKILAKSAMNSPDAVRRFEREARAAARLIHPNIVTAFDAGESQGVHFLVMEFVDGGDLAGLVKSQGPLPVDKAVDYVLQAARGLEYAHGEGVVHRDIKPANLLLDKKGVVKILDMGLARLEGLGADAAAQDGLTQSGQVMGTVDYMAPEQAVDTRTADAKADVYALGCTLHRLLVGENVYGGETLVQKLLAHRENPIPSIAAKRNDVPPAVDAVFRKMVAKRPEERYQTMREVIEALETAKHAPAAPSIQINVAAAPRTAVSREAKPSAPAAAAARAKPQAKGAGRKPPLKWIAAGVGGFALLVLGVILIVRNSKNEEVARIEGDVGTKVTIPAGGSVEVVSVSPKPAALPKSTAVSSPPSFMSAIASTPASLQDDYALEFDGKGTVTFDRPLNASPTQCTIEAYIRADALGTNVEAFAPSKGQSAFGATSVNGNSWVLWHNMAQGGHYSVRTTRDVFRQGKRIHLAAVRDTTGFRLYVDGKLSGQSSLKDVQLANETNAPLLGKQFQGLIDELRVSKIIRYTGDFTPQSRFEPDADTLALYHFDEGTGDLLHDASGNKHDGKIVGAKWVRADGAAISEPRTLVSGAPSSAPLLTRGALKSASPLDALKRENIPPTALAIAGEGDPAKAPVELVAILGVSGTSNLGADPVDIALSDDGRTLVTSSYYDRLDPPSPPQLWDPATGTSRVTLTGVRGSTAVRTMSLTADGRLLATSGQDDVVRLFDATTGAELGQLPEGAAVTSLEFNPAGTQLVGGTSDGRVRMWDVASRTRRFEIDANDVSSLGIANAKPSAQKKIPLTFHPDGKSLVVAALCTTGEKKSKQSALVFYDAATGKRLSSLRSVNQAIGRLKFGPDGQTLYFDGGSNLYSLDLRRPPAPDRDEFDARTPGFYNFTVSPGGRLIAGFGAKKQDVLTLYDAVTMQEMKSWAIPVYGRILFDPTERYLLAGLGDGTAYVLRLADPPTMPTTPVAVAPGSPNAAAPVDLFKHIDPALSRPDSKGNIRSVWIEDGKVLETGVNVFLPIKFQPPETYALELRFTRRKDPREFKPRLTLGLAAGERRFGFVLNRDSGTAVGHRTYSGFELVDGEQAGRNETVWMDELPTDDQSHTLRIEVRTDGASAAIDGRTVSEFKGPMSRLSAPDTKAGEGLAVGSETPLWLIGQTSLHISSLKLTPLGPAAAPPPVAHAPGSPSPLDALKHENIPAEDLQFAGLGDPAKVPAEVVAIAWKPPVNQHTADSYRSWQSPNSNAALSPDGSKLAFQAQSTKIFVRDLVAGPAADFTIDHLGAFKSIEFAPDGSAIVTGMLDGGIRFLSAADGKLLKTFGENRIKSGAEFKGMTVGPDGKTVVAGYGKGSEQVVLWNVATGEGRVLVEGNTQPVFAYSPDGRYVATTVGGGTGKFQRWDATTGREVGVLKDKMHGVALAWNSDGKTIAVANGAKGIKLWDAETKEPGREIPAESNNTCLICFAPDGPTLAVADQGRVDLWDIATGERMRTLTLGPPEGRFNSLAFDATGRYLVTGNGNGTAYVIRLSDSPVPVSAIKPTASPPEPTASARLGNAAPIDLLALVDPARDAVTGTWQKDAQGLTRTSVESETGINIPYVPPAEYDLVVRMAVGKLKAGPADVGIGFVLGGRQGAVALNRKYQGEDVTALIDLAKKKEARAPGQVLPANTTTTVTLSIRKDGVSASADGHPILSWHGDGSELSLDKPWAVSNPKTLFLFLGTTHGDVTFEQLTLIPVVPAAAKPGEPNVPTK